MERAKWVVREQEESFVREAVRECGIDEVVARLLYNRDVRDPAAIRSFFDVDISRLLDATTLPDMEKAVSRIRTALANGEKITIYGDYDVDGITSVVVLYKYLTSHGGDVSYYIPDRKEEGYGLNETALETIREGGTTLLVTVDTGTTAVEEAKKARELGMDLIVTDHHECKECLPDCVAVVNPKRADCDYPYKELAGVGVVFKLVCALEGDVEHVFADYGDLVSIGTVADIMSLRGENRILVSLGLKRLQKHLCPGIRALIEASGKARNTGITTGVIAYQIAPRLNAAGRIGDPKTSVELLLCENYAEAQALSAKLCDENRERQQKEMDILNDVERILASRSSDDRILVVGSENWHHGVIGIVASRIVEKYYRPCILICFDADKAKGSARSIRGVSIFDLLCRVSGTLEKFGGHDMAAGLTLERSRYEEFAADICRVANETITDAMLVPVVEAEMELLVSQLSLDLVHRLQKLEPFGTGNPMPVFLVRGLRVTDLYPVGAGKHLKILLEGGGREFSAMYFGMTVADTGIAVGDTVNVICSLSENVFNGTSSLLLNIKGIRPDDATEQADRESYGLYQMLRKGENPEELHMTRADAVALYKYLLRQKNAQITRYDARALARTVRGFVPAFSFGKLLACLDVFSELELLTYTFDGRLLNVTFADLTQRVDLQRSATWNRIGMIG